MLENSRSTAALECHFDFICRALRTSFHLLLTTIQPALEAATCMRKKVSVRQSTTDANALSQATDSSGKDSHVPLAANLASLLSSCEAQLQLLATRVASAFRSVEQGLIRVRSFVSDGLSCGSSEFLNALDPEVEFKDGPRVPTHDKSETCDHHPLIFKWLHVCVEWAGGAHASRPLMQNKGGTRVEFDHGQFIAIDGVLDCCKTSSHAVAAFLFGVLTPAICPDNDPIPAAAPGAAGLQQQALPQMGSASHVKLKKQATSADLQATASADSELHLTQLQRAVVAQLLATCATDNKRSEHSNHDGHPNLFMAAMRFLLLRSGLHGLTRHQLQEQAWVTSSGFRSLRNMTQLLAEIGRTNRVQQASRPRWAVVESLVERCDSVLPVWSRMVIAACSGTNAAQKALMREAIPVLADLLEQYLDGLESRFRGHSPNHDQRISCLPSCGQPSGVECVQARTRPEVAISSWLATVSTILRAACETSESRTATSGHHAGLLHVDVSHMLILNRLCKDLAFKLISMSEIPTKESPRRNLCLDIALASFLETLGLVASHSSKKLQVEAIRTWIAVLVELDEKQPFMDNTEVGQANLVRASLYPCVSAPNFVSNLTKAILDPELVPKGQPQWAGTPTTTSTQERLFRFLAQAAAHWLVCLPLPQRQQAQLLKFVLSTCTLHPECNEGRPMNVVLQCTKYLLASASGESASMAAGLPVITAADTAHEVQQHGAECNTCSSAATGSWKLKRLIKMLVEGSCMASHNPESFFFATDAAARPNFGSQAEYQEHDTRGKCIQIKDVSNYCIEVLSAISKITTGTLDIVICCTHLLCATCAVLASRLQRGHKNCADRGSGAAHMPSRDTSAPSCRPVGDTGIDVTCITRIAEAVTHLTEVSSGGLEGSSSAPRTRGATKHHHPDLPFCTALLASSCARLFLNGECFAAKYDCDVATRGAVVEALRAASSCLSQQAQRTLSTSCPSNLSPLFKQLSCLAVLMDALGASGAPDDEKQEVPATVGLRGVNTSMRFLLSWKTLSLLDKAMVCRPEVDAGGCRVAMMAAALSEMLRVLLWRTAWAVTREQRALVQDSTNIGAPKATTLHHTFAGNGDVADPWDLQHPDPLVEDTARETLAAWCQMPGLQSSIGVITAGEVPCCPDDARMLVKVLHFLAGDDRCCPPWLSAEGVQGMLRAAAGADRYPAVVLTAASISPQLLKGIRLPGNDHGGFVAQSLATAHARFHRQLPQLRAAQVGKGPRQANHAESHHAHVAQEHILAALSAAQMARTVPPARAMGGAVKATKNKHRPPLAKRGRRS